MWAGFLLSVGAFFSYFAFFVEFPVTRNFPWANLLLFLIAAILLVVGLRRAYGSPEVFRGKIFGPILTVLSLAICVLFTGIFLGGRKMPSAAGAPQVGTRAPEFTLSDSDNQRVSLAGLLSEPLAGTVPKGVMLVFYRGYW